MRSALGLALLVALAGVGCLRSAAAAHTASAPKLCAAPEVRQTVMRFVAALNRGDRAALDVVWAQEPDFQWYSTQAPGERLAPSSSYRASLMPYFIRRIARGEHMKLTWLRSNGNVDAEGLKPYGNFAYRLVRSARDLPPTDYHGKGALHCYPGRSDALIVWSMAEAR